MKALRGAVWFVLVLVVLLLVWAIGLVSRNPMNYNGRWPWEGDQ